MRERVNYFILNNGALFSTDNCGIENNLEDCIYIEKQEQVIVLKYTLVKKG